MKVGIVNKSGFELPEYKTILSAGCDLKAVLDAPLTIQPLGSAVVGTGIYVSLPAGYEGQVRGRSGLNFNCGIVVFVGTIDADYRGEIKVKLYNLSDMPFTIENGDRIAQLIISKIEQAEWVELDSLDETERGTKGFGSTGKK